MRRAMNFAWFGGMLLGAASAGPLYAQWIPTPLTDNDVDDMNPRVSQGNFVWSREGNVIYYSGGGEMDLGAGRNPRISGSNAAWANGSSILWYNGTSTQTLATDADANSFTGPDIDASRVAWTGEAITYYNSGVWVSDAGGPPTDVSWDQQLPGPYTPRISGAYTAYVNINGLNVFDGTDYVKLGQEGIRGWDMSGPYVAYVQEFFGFGGYWLSLYDTTTATSTTIAEVAAASAPALSGSRLVWDYAAGGDFEIGYYGAGGIMNLSDNDYDDLLPDISGSLVVWQGWDNEDGDWEIFLHNLDTMETTQITHNTTDDLAPQIDGNTIVWYGDDGGDFEIYTATPEPSSMALVFVAAAAWLFARRRRPRR